MVVRVGILTNASASLVVYSGTPGSLTELACGAPEQLVTSYPRRDDELHVLSATTGAGVRPTVQDVTPVPNDLIENATPIALPFSVTQSTTQRRERGRPLDELHWLWDHRVVPL